MTREEFNKNSYLVNNNALYNKHTEHISTTEPIFIDGMAGSDNIVHEREGDASQNTYWAYEYESGKFMLGKFNEDDIKVKCETDSSNLWIVDAEGVYIEQDALDSYMESDCLDAINAKYGTNFSTLTMQKVKSIDIGDTVPNWNAYEKIELPNRFLWKYREMGGERSVFGKVENDILICYAKSQGHVLIADENGLIIYDTNVGEEFFVYIIKPRLNNLGITYTTISYDTSSYSENDNVENWNDYIDIT